MVQRQIFRRHVDGDRIDIAGNGPRAAIGLQGRHGQHTGAGADIGDVPEITDFFQARYRRHAAMRGGVLAGAEGQACFDAEGPIADAHRIGVIGGVDDEAPGSHRHQVALHVVGQ